MDSNKKDVLYLNVTLNRKKERSAIIMDVLEALPNKSRSDFVKTALLYYIQSNQHENENLAQLIKNSVQEVLSENGIIAVVHDQTIADDVEETENEADQIEKQESMKKVNNEKLAKLANRFSS